MRIAYVPEVANDLVAAKVWYETRAAGLGEDFLRMAFAAFSEIEEFPEKNEVAYKIFRRSLLRRFPYCIYYIITHNLIRVYGVYHSSRDPQTIKQLLDVR